MPLHRDTHLCELKFSADARSRAAMNYQISEQDVGTELEADSPFVADFLDLPFTVYNNANSWGSVFAASSRGLKSRDAVRHQLRRFPPHTARAFLVTRDALPVARAVAYIDPLLGRDSIGQIGYFEAFDDSTATALLFENVVRWLRTHSVQRIVGPMDGDTWHRYRLNVGPFEQPFFFLEPINPPYYQQLWESFGFAPLEEYYSMRVDDLREVETAYLSAAQSMREQGYATRAIDLARFEEELTLLFTLTTDIFSGNFLYTPISREEYLKMYVDLRPVLRPEYVTFIYAPSGEPVGFLFGVPDFMEGATPSTFNLKTLGIKAAHRRAGLAKGLFSDAYQMALAQGFEAANLCLIRQGNPSGYLDAGKGRQIRTYLLYELR